MRSILTVGGLACLNPLLTNALIEFTGAAVGARAGTAALAGYATAARLEYVLMPIAFGLSAPMIALVGANIGAGQRERARGDALASVTLMDIVPTTVKLTDLRKEVAQTYWHWFFLAQPAPLPERMIQADPDFSFETGLFGWGRRDRKTSTRGNSRPTENLGVMPRELADFAMTIVPRFPSI
jgi:hypothetical protein